MFGSINTPEGRTGFHLSTTKPARVVPGAERHKWDGKTERGKPATCLKCGCQRLYYMWETWYQLKGETKRSAARPPCTGSQ